MSVSKIAAILLTLLPFFAAASAAENNVMVPVDVLYKPTFLSADSSMCTGTAFVVRGDSGKSRYLVTAHSIFGPYSGLDRQWNSEQVANVINAAVGVSADNPKHVIVAQPYICIPDARPQDDHGSERDIAIFTVRTMSEDTALEFEDIELLMNERVFVLFKREDSMTPTLIPATVAWLSTNEIRYLFEDSKEELKSMMGSPVLSIDGKVVAMHQGTFIAKSGRKYGYATPASAIREVIDTVETPSLRVVKKVARPIPPDPNSAKQQEQPPSDVPVYHVPQATSANKQADSQPKAEPAPETRLAPAPTATQSPVDTNPSLRRVPVATDTQPAQATPAPTKKRAAPAPAAYTSITQPAVASLVIPPPAAPTVPAQPAAAPAPAPTVAAPVTPVPATDKAPVAPVSQQAKQVDPKAAKPEVSKTPVTAPAKAAVPQTAEKQQAKTSSKPSGEPLKYTARQDASPASKANPAPAKTADVAAQKSQTAPKNVGPQGKGTQAGSKDKPSSAESTKDAVADSKSSSNAKKSTSAASKSSKHVMTKAEKKAAKEAAKAEKAAKAAEAKKAAAAKKAQKAKQAPKDAEDDDDI